MYLISKYYYHIAFRCSFAFRRKIACNWLDIRIYSSMSVTLMQHWYMYQSICILGVTYTPTNLENKQSTNTSVKLFQQSTLEFGVLSALDKWKFKRLFIVHILSRWMVWTINGQWSFQSSIECSKLFTEFHGCLKLCILDIKVIILS